MGVQGSVIDVDINEVAGARQGYIILETASGARLSGTFHGQHLSVPLFSFTYLTGMYSGTEAVYSFYNPTTYYHEWYVYEWGEPVGSSQGWVISYKFKS